MLGKVNVMELNRSPGLALTMFLALSLATRLLWAHSVDGPVNLAGEWRTMNHEDIGDAAVPGDYMGMPINDEARARADAWSASTQSLPERQCIMYTSFYTVLGPAPLRIAIDYDPISGKEVSVRMTGFIDRTPRTIWLDGRPHPSKYARHTAAGFSTGVWQGDTLVVNTTHLTETLVGRTGVPASDQATVTEYITRHGDTLRITMFLHDPVYFDGPYVRSRAWVLDPTIRTIPEPCEPVSENDRPPGEVPHYLPGTNPFIKEASEKSGIPLEAVRGGVNTTFPEYAKALKTVRGPARAKN